MARRKYKPFPPWKTATRNGMEKAFVQVGLSQLDHPAILNLNHAAFRVYIYMLLEAGNGQSLQYPRSKYERFISRRGFEEACKELIDAGFIEVAENWQHVRKPTVYALKDAWRYKIRP